MRLDVTMQDARRHRVVDSVRWRRAVRESKQPRLGWQGNLVVALVFAFLIWTFVDRRSSGPSSEQEVMRIERSAGRVETDGSLDDLLGGRAAIPASAVVAAYCVNGWYWATDVTLNTNVVVASKDRLINAAAFVADGSFPKEFVTAVEREILERELETPAAAELSEALRARFGEERLTSYLARATQPATAANLERFVVYAVSESTYRQRIEFIDLERRDRNAIRRFMGELSGGHAVRIGGSPDLINVSQSDCARLAS